MTLETSVEQYAESLSRLIDSLKSAQNELRELSKHQNEMNARFSEVGRVISFQPQTDEADHALALLAWVMRSAAETVNLGEGALTGTRDAMANLEVRLKAAVDLIIALRSASAPAVEEARRQAG